ncbi:C-GCAxxG-C-C family (seleno)protein [Marinilabilia salmonicolor]|uniref:C-GCAxxG-C-C family (seleno)protein n=1 Tax=Marinilabilia salmonicolor TaxID=989 RepID=UPI00029AFD6F|nr:C-GCAxxG-C-C family (seleno)protein [Marinilabilia salmonicolor]
MVRDVSVKAKSRNAAWYYHHPDYGYNCAQAMVKHFGGSEEEIQSMRKMGSGRAPEGHCGALHGALYLLKKYPEAWDELIEKFSQQTGSPFCRSIRKENKASCRRCVEIADDVLLKIKKPLK